MREHKGFKGLQMVLQKSENIVRRAKEDRVTPQRDSGDPISHIKESRLWQCATVSDCTRVQGGLMRIKSGCKIWLDCDITHLEYFKIWGGGETLIKDILVSFKVDIVIVQETTKAKVDRPLCIKFWLLEVRSGRTLEHLELLVAYWLDL